jgi:imidazolonepropionase-like amidohydrolase
LTARRAVNTSKTIQAATNRPAKLLQLDQLIGMVQPGKRADLVGVAGNPLDDISNIRNVKLVIRDGCIAD